MLTSYAQKKMLDHALGISSWTMPTTVYLALFSASPGESGSLTSEFSGGSYARVSLTSLMGAFDSVTGIALNTSAVTFPAPTAVWGSLTYVAIVDASSSGNVLYYEKVSNPIVVNNGAAAPSFAVASITAQIAGATLAMISSYLMKKLGDHSLGKASYTMPTGVFFGLSASDPTIAGSLAGEVGVGGYSRQALTASMNATDASSGLSSNNVLIEFPTPTADYPSIAYSFIADAASAGNVLFSSQLPASLSIRNAGAVAEFPAGSINLTLA